MTFLDTWQTQLGESLAEATKKAAGIDDATLKHALTAVGIIWPLRRAIQEFDLEAIETVNQLLGSQAKYTLRFIQSMADEQLAAARELQMELAADADLAAAVDVLFEHFGTEATFASQPSDPIDIRHSTSSEATRPSRVFISYARKDAEDLAQELTSRLEAEGIPVWRDRAKMEGGRNWWLQIVAALDQVDFMILVVTPAAMRSVVVKKEWTYARQRGVCILPVWGAAPMALDTLPRWLRDTCFYQPEAAWSKLVAELNRTCQSLRVPFMVEKLADDFVPRAELLRQIEGSVIEGQGSIVGLYGAGGYGKTILAKAISHHDPIQAAYDDGILWVTLGRNPGDLTSRVIDLIEVLSGERPSFAVVDEAQARLVQLLGDRRILIVIDDVWNAAHLTPFLKGGPDCVRLITTRDEAILPPRTHLIEVSAMTATEAIDLLRNKLPNGLSQAFPPLADRLGYWPLLLKLANSTLRDRIFKNNQSLEAALNYVNKALNKRGLTAFDIHNTAAREQAVGQTLAVSLELLTDEERRRFY
ncbi:MAG: TIR domain-containing protein [Anaerolineae bacterium]|nr:TIR domain-containing protein [Anaerolineae bacterium]